MRGVVYGGFVGVGDDFDGVVGAGDGGGGRGEGVGAGVGD